MKEEDASEQLRPLLDLHLERPILRPDETFEKYPVHKEVNSPDSAVQRLLVIATPKMISVADASPHTVIHLDMKLDALVVGIQRVVDQVVRPPLRRVILQKKRMVKHAYIECITMVVHVRIAKVTSRCPISSRARVP